MNLINYFRYFIEYILVIIFFFIINLLPLNISSKLGAFIFKNIGTVTRNHKIAIRNCESVFPQLGKNKINEIVNKSWENLGQTIFELGRLNQITKNNNSIKIIGSENISEIVKKNSQAIFIGIHQSNWEICVPLLDSLGITIGAIYRHINNFFIDKFVFNKRKSSLKSNVSFYTPKGKRSAKDIVDGIKKNNSVFLLIDQKDSAGEEINLFNKSVKTQLGFLKIARKYKLPIIPMENQRLENGNFKIIFYEPIIHSNPKITDQEMMLKIHSIIEKWIKRNPTQWFWQHNRFS